MELPRVIQSHKHLKKNKVSHELRTVFYEEQLCHDWLWASLLIFMTNILWLKQNCDRYANIPNLINLRANHVTRKLGIQSQWINPNPVASTFIIRYKSERVSIFVISIKLNTGLCKRFHNLFTLLTLKDQSIWFYLSIYQVILSHCWDYLYCCVITFRS